MNIAPGMIDDLIRGGVHALPTQEARAALIDTQRLVFMEDVARQASAHGLTSDEVLGAHAMLGVRNLDGIESAAIADAVAASKAVKRNDVAVIAYFADHNPVSDGPQLANEIRTRGVNVSVYDGDRLRVRDGELWYTGVDGAADTKITLPEAVITRGVPTRRMQPFEDAGVHMANRASVRPITLSKNAQAPLFKANDVAHPYTYENLSSTDEVRAAVDELGFPAVVKTSNGAGGRGVWIPKSAEELDDVIRKNPKAFENPKPESLLVQEYVDVGGADDRVTVARDMAGEYDVVSVHHRQGLGDSGIANGPEGSLYTRVPMSEVDEVTKQEAIKAAKAIGLDYAGIDVVTTSSGRKIVLEGNGTPGIPELDVPLPREEQSMPHIADWLVYGTRP
jgi:glutathione synthase/RimK-type ligase-like ATP-grasp enzyme